MKTFANYLGRAGFIQLISAGAGIIAFENVPAPWGFNSMGGMNATDAQLDRMADWYGIVSSTIFALVLLGILEVFFWAAVRLTLWLREML
jgi:hypothetical protein